MSFTILLAGLAIILFFIYFFYNLGSSFMRYNAVPGPNWGNGGMDRINYYHLLFGSLWGCLAFIFLYKVET